MKKTKTLSLYISSVLHFLIFLGICASISSIERIISSPVEQGNMFEALVMMTVVWFFIVGLHILTILWLRANKKWGLTIAGTIAVVNSVSIILLPLGVFGLWKYFKNVKYYKAKKII